MCAIAWVTNAKLLCIYSMVQWSGRHCSDLCACIYGKVQTLSKDYPSPSIKITLTLRLFPCAPRTRTVNERAPRARDALQLYGERGRKMDFLEDEEGEIGGHDGVVGGHYF